MCVQIVLFTVRDRQRKSVAVTFCGKENETNYLHDQIFSPFLAVIAGCRRDYPP